MRNEDLERFREIMTGVSEVVGKSLSPVGLEMYFRLMSDCTIEQFESAMQQAMRAHKYATIPTPAELREFLFASKGDRSVLAWTEVDYAITAYGGGSSVAFEDGVINSTIMTIGGWPRLCHDYTELDAKGRSFFIRDFRQTYEILAARGGEHPKILFGMYDNQNILNNWLDPETLILKLPTGVQRRIEIGFIDASSPENRYISHEEVPLIEEGLDE